MAEEFTLANCPYCGSERAVFPEDSELLACYHCGRSYSQVLELSKQQPPAEVLPAARIGLQTVTTTDGTLEVYGACDLSSAVLARLAKNVEIQIGPPVVIQGREWMQATLADGNLGYVLAPSARGHTTLQESRVSLVEHLQQQHGTGPPSESVLTR